MGGTSMTLEEALARIDELEREVAEELDSADAVRDTLYETEHKLDEATEEHDQVCRRCFKTFTAPGDRQYCSRDCREFRRQEPFETLWKQLHPNGSREPNQKFASAL